MYAAIPTDSVLMLLALCAVPVLALLALSVVCFAAVFRGVVRDRASAVVGLAPRLEVVETRPMATVAPNEAA